MGAATRASLEAIRQQIPSLQASIAEVEGVFHAGRAIASQPALLAALAGPGSTAAQRTTLAERALAALPAGSKALVRVVVEKTWSRPGDLLAGVEELGVRLWATASASDLTGEILALSRAIRANSELQLALSNKRAKAEGKMALLGELFGRKVQPATLEIARHIVALPRGRRVTDALVAAAAMVADQRGEALAEVRVARELGAEQRASLARTLEGRFGRPHYLDVVVDESVVGGVRVRVGDVVIDSSVNTQLAEMKRRLAS